MAKPATATWGTDTHRVHVCYVKSRRVLQLSGETNTPATVEVPLSEFCHNLDIDASQLGPPYHYLLFAHIHNTRGGSARHIIETFATEDEARTTYQALRLHRSHPDDWAETVSLDASGRLRSLCWFGTPWRPGGGNRTFTARYTDNTVDEQQEHRWIRRWRRHTPISHEDLTIPDRPAVHLREKEAPNSSGSGRASCFVNESREATRVSDCKPYLT